MIARVDQASKSYKTGDTTVTALQPTDLVVNESEFLLIIGPSGSGKTTLLSLLGCVIYPSTGRVVINNTDTNSLNANQMAELRLRTIGFIFQNFNLVAPLSVEENVLVPLRLQGVAEREAEQRMVQALETMGMSHRRKSLPKMLSGGEQQRVAIARALVTNPPLLLCDEPTASLDAKSADVVMHQLRKLADAGKAVAVVTHDMRLRPFADRIVEVSEGQAREVAKTMD